MKAWSCLKVKKYVRCRGRTTGVCATGLVWSRRLGLSGRCDVVEFHPDGTIYPVEYKHGKKQKWLNDDLQVGAQALCLEEMLNVSIERGAIFHKGSQHRREVEFTSELRRQVEETARAIHALLASGQLPSPINNQRCPQCSLINVCMPGAIADKARQKKASKSLFECEESYEK